MSRLTIACIVGFTLLRALHISGGVQRGPIIDPQAPPTQGNRLFDDICKGCIVSNGYGFVTDPDDCNCFYQCKYVRSYKLSPMASDWVSTKMCCPCGESWSMKALTCVSFTDKRSDCFKTGGMAPDNVCDGVSDGVLIPRRSPNSAAGDYMCAGFVRCTTVDRMGPNGDDRVMPYADCCEPGDCFSGTTCSADACSTNADCNSHDAPDDCQKPTVAPTTECLYISVPDTDTQFMAKETMDRFDCAQGTCWDDDLCACVATNNTGYNDCDRPFFNMDFDGNMLNSEDGRGNTIWAEATSGITFTGGSAIFDGTEEYINIGGLAASYIGPTFVAHLEIIFEDNDGIFTADQSECIFGNCLPSQNPGSDTDTIMISVIKDASGVPTDITAHITYQNTAFMLGNSMATVDLQASGSFALDTDYEIWLILCGKTENVALGVLNTDTEDLVGYAFDIEPVPGVTSVIMGQSGFVFGKCPTVTSDTTLEGTINEVEFWKYCKPFGDSEFQMAYDEIFG